MNVVDIRIFFIGYLLSILLCVIVIASLWRHNRKRSPEISLWLANHVLQFVAILLVTFRGIIPDILSIVVANLFIVSGTVVFYIGLGRYVGKETRRGHNYVMLIVFTLAHVYLTYVYPDIALRTVNQSLALIYICAQISRLMLSVDDRFLRSAARPTGIIYFFFCLVSFFQIVVSLAVPQTSNIFVSGIFNLFGVLAYQMLFIALTFALFLMVNRRLSTSLESELSRRIEINEDLQQSEEKFAKAFQTSPYAVGIIRMKDGRFIEINDTFTLLTGYSREEMTMESDIRPNLWADEKDREEIVSMLSRGLPVSGRELLFRKKNGKFLTGLFSAQTIHLNREPCLLLSIGDITELKKAEWDLKERIKELNCLYSISALIETQDISLDEIMGKAVMLLPPALQFPEITEARIMLAEKVFQTAGFTETPWIMTNRIIVSGKPAGHIEICYVEERPTVDEGPFLTSERQLLKDVAERLGHVVERNCAAEQIKLNATRLASLLSIMQYRTETTQEFLDHALNEVIILTDSKIGYIYIYHEDTQQFVLNTWSKDVMKECTIANPQTCYELEKTGIWGEAVRQRKPIILNDFEADHPLKRGYPEGHAHLKKFMTVPLFQGNAVVAVVGVANKDCDYDEADVLQLTLFMDAVWKSVGIKLNEENLRESEERLRAITNSAYDAITMMDNSGNISYWNPAAERILGYTRQEAIGQDLHTLITPERFIPAYLEAFPPFQQTGEGRAIGKTLEFSARRKDGQEIDVALSLSAVYLKGTWHSVGIIQDITERKRTEKYREMGSEILQILSKPGMLHDVIENVLIILKKYTGFDAIGIRMRSGEDFPYIVQKGFSHDFLLTENTLTERDGAGGLCRDADGNVALQCTCGLVLSGKTDPFNPLFTKGGSFWTNDSSSLADLPASEDPRVNSRNTCLDHGYASMALVPIRNMDTIIGLIQFNDYGKNRLSLAAVEQLEGIAANIGEALQRIEAERALQETRDYLDKLITYASAPIITWDPGYAITRFNRAFEHLSGMKASDVIGKNLDMLFPMESKEESLSRIRMALGGEFWESVEIPILRTDGKIRTVLWNSANIYGSDGKTLVSTIAQGNDITERKQAEEKILHFATHDYLTNLPGLRLAKDRMSVAVNMARRYRKAVAVMFIDLDGFKDVNDSLGHDAGDYVLKQVAQRMLSCVRDTDTVARVVGDEFLIVATEINTPNNAAQIAEKIIKAVSRPVPFNGNNAVVGTSIGIALFPDDGEDMDQLIKLADKAMYKVKYGGKNGFSFADAATNGK